MSYNTSQCDTIVVEIDRPGEIIYVEVEARRESVEVETRGEARKRKNRERQTANRAKASRSVKNLENDKRKKRKTNTRNARKIIRMENDRLAGQIGVPLRILDMDNDFQKKAQDHALWPLEPQPEVAIHALSEFRDMVSLDELREMPCAVCSGLYPKNDWIQVPVENIDISLLKSPHLLTLPFFEINFNYEHPRIDDNNLKILLDRAGFIYHPSYTPEHQDGVTASRFNHQSSSPFDLRICKSCHNCLKKRRTPSLSLANNMWIGSTPPCLQGLTIPEQLLISPGYLCMNLIQLTKRRHTHHKLKGHVVTLPQNPASLTKVLPLPMYKLCENLKVVFVGPGSPTDQQLKKVLQVRKSKISEALRWLFKHNILFQDKIKFDEDALNALPEGEIPEALTVTTTAVNLDPQVIEHYTGYTHDPLDDDENHDDPSEEESFDFFTENDTVGSARELRSSGIIHVDNASVSGKELTLSALQKLTEKSDISNYYGEDGLAFAFDNDISPCEAGPSQPRTIRMPHSNKPLNEYKDPTLFPAGFPVLFPYGVGGHEDEHRLQHISLKVYTKHLMRHHDPKFRHHRSFPFVAFNILQRREVSSNAYSLTKYPTFARSAKLIATLTPEDLKLANEQEQKKQPITNPAILELLRNINTAGSKLMASHQSRARMRNELRAVTIRDGAPSLFITINPADLHSPIVMMYAGKEIDFKNLPLNDFPTATERSRLAHLDPSAVSKYFDVVITLIIKTIVGYGKAKGGAFGPVKNYYGVKYYNGS